MAYWCQFYFGRSVDVGRLDTITCDLWGHVISLDENGLTYVVKVQFSGPVLFKENGALFQEEVCLFDIFMPSWTTWRYDCGWTASMWMSFWCFCRYDFAIWQPFHRHDTQSQNLSTGLSARGCHALQRAIAWEFSYTYIVTSWSQHRRPKHGGLANRWGSTCHVYRTKFAIKKQC